MSSRTYHPTETRQRVLSAAHEILAQSGAGRLTLEAVAQRAGVSKGGLLHHFASKDALLEAILNASLTAFIETVEPFYDRQNRAKGRWMRAYIQASFESGFAEMDLRAFMGLLIETPRLIERIREDEQFWMDRLTSDGLDASRVIVLKRAADGQYLDNLLRISRSASDNATLMREMLALVDPEGGAS